MESFKVGDMVKHRASGEKAVVIEVISLCNNPRHLTSPIGCLVNGKRSPECHLVPNRCMVKYGFDKLATPMVEELEKA
jgi:hypothetical protein